MKLVIFDVDGTLVDSQAHIMAAMTRAFAAVGLECPARGEVLRIVGLSLPEAFAVLAPEVDAATQTGLVEGYKNSFAALRAEGKDVLSPLYPGARAVLDDLAARDEMLLAVATGKSRRGMRHVLEMHGLEGLFQSVQTADDHPSKPHPSMIQTCLRDTGLDPGNAVMIGDTVFDMDMARAAGVKAIGVDWGYHPVTALQRSGAVQVLQSFEALLPALDEVWGRP